MQSAVKERVKALLVETLMLPMGPHEITDDQTLFGPGSLGLDSVDALQLVVMLDKHFNLKIPNPEVAQEIFRNVGTIVDAVQKNGATSEASA